MASTARCLGPPSGSCRLPSATSNGPRIRNSTMPSTPTVPAAPHPAEALCSDGPFADLQTSPAAPLPAVATVGIEPATSEAASHGKETDALPPAILHSSASSHASPAPAIAEQDSPKARATVVRVSNDGGFD